MLNEIIMMGHMIGPVAASGGYDPTVIRLFPARMKKHVYGVHLSLNGEVVSVEIGDAPADWKSQRYYYPADNDQFPLIKVAVSQDKKATCGQPEDEVEAKKEWLLKNTSIRLKIEGLSKRLLPGLLSDLTSIGGGDNLMEQASRLKTLMEAMSGDNLNKVVNEIAVKLASIIGCDDLKSQFCSQLVIDNADPGITVLSGGMMSFISTVNRKKGDNGVVDKFEKIQIGGKFYLSPYSRYDQIGCYSNYGLNGTKACPWLDQRTKDKVANILAYLGDADRRGKTWQVYSYPSGKGKQKPRRDILLFFAADRGRLCKGDIVLDDGLESLLCSTIDRMWEETSEINSQRVSNMLDLASTVPPDTSVYVLGISLGGKEASNIACSMSPTVGRIQEMYEEWKGILDGLGYKKDIFIKNVNDALNKEWCRNAYDFSDNNEFVHVEFQDTLEWFLFRPDHITRKIVKALGLNHSNLIVDVTCRIKKAAYDHEPINDNKATWDMPTVKALSVMAVRSMGVNPDESWDYLLGEVISRYEDLQLAYHDDNKIQPVGREMMSLAFESPYLALGEIFRRSKIYTDSSQEVNSKQWLKDCSDKFITAVNRLSNVKFTRRNMTRDPLSRLCMAMGYAKVRV